MQNYISEKKDTTRSQELSTEFNFGNSKNVEKIPLNQHKKKKSSSIKVLFQNLNIQILFLNIIGIIFYKISFIGCHGGEENYCITEFVTQFIILGILLIISTLIVSITITLILWRKIYFYHLIYIIQEYLNAQKNY